MLDQMSIYFTEDFEYDCFEGVWLDPYMVQKI
jgi:hypothetical protein